MLIFSYIANFPSKLFTVFITLKFFRIIGNNFKLLCIDNISQHSISASRDSIDLICPSFKDITQLILVICTCHIDEMVILNIGSHILQILRSIVFQCDTNGIHRNTSVFESRNLIRTIPVRILQRLATAPRCTVRNEDNIARTRLIATTIQIIICFLECSSIVGAAVGFHRINLAIDSGQVCCQTLINFDCASIICATIFVLMRKTNNS